MRKIKFRAKAMSKKNTNWHYGLVRSIAKDGTGFLQDQRRNCVHINIETLGQYTGLEDKNGKEIYEGDILRKEGYWDMRVEYDDGCFMCRDADRVRYANLCFDQFISRVDLTGWEVVGNIYENPELLEAQND